MFVILLLFIKNPYFSIFSTPPKVPQNHKSKKCPPKQKKPTQTTKAYYHLVGFGGIFETDNLIC